MSLLSLVPRYLFILFFSSFFRAFLSNLNFLDTIVQNPINCIFKSKSNQCSNDKLVSQIFIPTTYV